MPRTRREWALSILTILVAAVIEEAAYRGVAMSILWYSLGNPWLAAFLSGLAFAFDHWVQGGKSGLAILAIALTMQAPVPFTGTLILAMIVHALYDIAASLLIARQATLDESEKRPLIASFPPHLGVQNPFTPSRSKHRYLLEDSQYLLQTVSAIHSRKMDRSSKSASPFAQASTASPAITGRPAIESIEGPPLSPGLRPKKVSG